MYYRFARTLCATNLEFRNKSLIFTAELDPSSGSSCKWESDSSGAVHLSNFSFKSDFISGTLRAKSS